jgi:hypothetical protein
MFVPKEQKDKIDAAKKEDSKWSLSKVLEGNRGGNGSTPLPPRSRSTATGNAFG